MRVTAVVTHEPPWYVARCPEADVATQGGTAAEALANLEDALTLLWSDQPPRLGTEPPLVTTIDLPG